MKIDLFCDASHCPESRIASYGYLIIRDKDRYSGGAEFAGRVGNSASAEMQAVATTIFTGLMKGWISRGDNLAIYTDCMSVILAFDGARKNVSFQEMRSINHVNKLLLLYSLTATFYHVKSHSSARDRNSVSNRLCDKIANGILREIKLKNRREGNG